MQIFGDEIRFGVQCTTSRTPYDRYVDNWLTCERLGFDIAYVTDHFAFPTEGGPDISVWESTTLLSAMASVTSRMRCGFMVLGNTFRNPGILAKTAVTLDHISKGRFELGLGSGNSQYEHAQFDIPFHTAGVRLRMLGESLQIVRSLLSDKRTTFTGRYYNLNDAICEPKPVQSHLPLLVGAIGEQLALRNVALSADIWNVYDTPLPEVLKRRQSALERHCADLGREARDIRASMHIKPLIGESEAEIAERAGQQPRARSRGTPQQIIDELLDYVRLGISDFVFMLDAPADMRSLELIATRVAPAVREEGKKIRSEMKA